MLPARSGAGPPAPRASRNAFMAASSSALGAAIGLDAIAVRIDDEPGVVAGPVVGAQPRLAVVPPAGFQRGGVEGVDALARRGIEADVEARLVVGRHRALRRADPQGNAVAPVADRAGLLAEARVAERLQSGVV